MLAARDIDFVARYRKIEERVRRLETRKRPRGGGRLYIVDELELGTYLDAGPDGVWDLPTGGGWPRPKLSRVQVPNPSFESGYEPSDHIFGQGLIRFRAIGSGSSFQDPVAIRVASDIPLEWRSSSSNTDWSPLYSLPDVFTATAPDPIGGLRRHWAAYMTAGGVLELNDAPGRSGFMDFMGFWGAERGGSLDTTTIPGSTPQALATTSTLGGRLIDHRDVGIQGWLTTTGEGRAVAFSIPDAAYPNDSFGGCGFQCNFSIDSPEDSAAGVFFRADSANDRLWQLRWRKLPDPSTSVRLELVLWSGMTASIKATGADFDLGDFGADARLVTLRGGVASVWDGTNQKVSFSGTFSPTSVWTEPSSTAPATEGPSGPFVDVVDAASEPRIVAYTTGFDNGDRSGGWVQDGVALSLDHFQYCTSMTTF